MSREGITVEPLHGAAEKMIAQVLDLWTATCSEARRGATRGS